MAYYAQLKSNFDAAKAQFVADFTQSTTTLITDIDAGNVSPTLSSVVDASTSSPTVNISVRVQGARHYHFAVENVEGKTPHFVVNRGRLESGTLLSTNIPVYTTDFETWTQVTNRQLIGGTSGTIEFDTAALPAGRVYFANAPLGRYIDSSLFTADMLTNHSAICSPTSSADVNGVYNTTPTENDDIGRAVGGNSQYAIKLSWPDATNDGLRKRKMVVLTQIHAAGESQSWTTFLDSVDWMINDASAEANAFRDNWDVYIYMPVTANGLKGGNRRTNFRSAQDPNRDFVLSGSSNLVEITQLRAAIEADTGGECDLFYSWHGFNIYSDNYIIGVTPDDYNSGTRMPVAAHMITHGQTLFGTSPNLQTSGTNNTDCWWGYAKLGAKASFDVEVHGSGNTTRSNYTTIATNWMKMAVEADSQNMFVTAQLEPPLLTNTNTFYNHTIVTGTQTLQPSLYTNDNTFYAATISLGAVTIQPELFANSNTFYAHNISQDGAAQTLQPGLFSNTNTFFAATVLPGSVTINPNLLSNENIFYAHSLSIGGQTLQPSLFTNTNQFYNATVQVGAVTIYPELFNNNNTFYVHAINQDGATQTLSPSLFTNSNEFYAATIQPGAVTIQPGLFANSNTFFAATVSATYQLQPSLFSNSNQFFGATVTVGAITLNPSLFVNTNVFYTHAIGGQNRVQWASSITINDYSAGITIQ